MRGYRLSIVIGLVMGLAALMASTQARAADTAAHDTHCLAVAMAMGNVADTQKSIVEADRQTAAEQPSADNQAQLDADSKLLDTYNEAAFGLLYIYSAATEPGDGERTQAMEMTEEQLLAQSQTCLN